MLNRKQHNTEIILHLLFWLFIFTAVNVQWASNWLDRSLRPNTPAPLSVFVFPIIFYAHALWAVPRYLSTRRWGAYLLSVILIFIVPELVRSAWMLMLDQDAGWWGAVNSRDSLLLGEPNVFWMALTFSFAYRFTKDWFIRQQEIEKLSGQLNHRSSPEIQPLQETEAQMIRQNLEAVLYRSQPYLNPELSLAGLAKLVGTTDKKLSTLLNQNMQTNFYDYINSFRIAAFKRNIQEGKLASFSVVGIALQCGFKSKSSFYRAFKKETGMPPTAFLK